MKRKCLNLVFSLGTLIAADTICAQWLLIDDSYQDETTYMDPTRVLQNGNQTLYWVLSKFKQPHPISGRPAGSTLNQMVVDCTRQVQPPRYIAWYENANGTGNVINFMNIPDDKLNFYPITPNSLGDREAKIACNAHKQ